MKRGKKCSTLTFSPLLHAFFFSVGWWFLLFFCSWSVGSLCVGHRYFLYILYSCSALYPASRARVDFILQFVFLYYILHGGTVIKTLLCFLLSKPSIQRLQKGLRELPRLKNPSLTLQAVLLAIKGFLTVDIMVLIISLFWVKVQKHIPAPNFTVSLPNMKIPYFIFLIKF